MTSRRPKRLIAATVLAVTGLLLASVGPASSAGTDKRPPKPTVVLVHGAFADASGWNGVIERLQDDGYPVIAPANPLQSLPTDAAYISSVLDTITGPVILVGHSYGGAVITNAANGHANVKALVYIAAFAPDQGDTVASLTGKFPGSRLEANLLVRPTPAGADGYVKPEAFRTVFAGDVSWHDASVMAATQRPANVAIPQTPSGPPAWKTIPSWYAVATNDQVIPAEAERFMAKRANAKTIEIKGSSHVAMISHDKTSTDLIKAAAKATR
ncbi:alpha/beta hydrolase (plasmid) [Embleya sp. NBC_00888]|uniref:alpha/beta fold hydrolase n=1 Tax=Embleya sp. NBC_00888 TaxID=2975960 RepID=UPI002F908373|nr:alpha/beta hydrolase [Embleya sp. NBC_00888]